MSAQNIAELVDQAKSWPEEDQIELLEYARSIEARRSGHYEATGDERIAIAEGLDQMRRGEFAADAQVAEMWASFRK